MNKFFSFLKGDYTINITEIDVMVYENFKLLSAMFALRTVYTCFYNTLAFKKKELIRFVNSGFYAFPLIILQGVLLSKHQTEQYSKQTNPI